jgi:hypothetical protein
VKLPAIVGVGLEVMATACEAEPVHPFAVVTVTVYVPAVEGLMEDVAAPLLHEYELIPAGALSVADEPLHTEKVPVIAGTGFGLTITAWAILAVHPPAPVTVTV